MKKYISGLTLVELIVTVTIIAILWTISAFFFFDSLWSSRDAGRVSDIDTITKAFEVFYTEKWFFPIPDNPTEVTYSWAVAWVQWSFWPQVNRNLDIFGSDYPKDPLYEIDYTYSTANNGQEYQIASIIENIQEDEWLWEITSILVPQAQAAVNTGYVRWNYNGFFVKPLISDVHYFVATPSIISSDLSDTDLYSTVTNQKLVFDKFFNLPSLYSNHVNTNGGFNFNVSDPLIFSWSLDDLRSEESLSTFLSNLKYIYSVTPTENVEQYVSLLEEESYLKLKRLLSENYNVNYNVEFDCRDIFDSGKSFGDQLYKIDIDGSWPIPSQNVYCDMTTGWWGWTRVGDNHITNGNFEGGNDISSNYYTFLNTDSDNEIVAINTPVWEYALHQTW